MWDDWLTGTQDQWTNQQDNRVILEWTKNGGASWTEIDTAYQLDDANSGYDVTSGMSSWSDTYAWDASGMTPGNYQVRVTPIDGRGNIGGSLISSEFAVFAPPSLPGDYNQDNTVDAADYSVWRGSLNQTTDPYAGADGNGDGQVTQLDYHVWRGNYGNTAPAEAALSEAHPSDSSTVATAPAAVSAAPSDHLLLRIVARRWTLQSRSQNP